MYFCCRTDNLDTVAEAPPLRQRALSVFEQRKIERALQEQQKILLEGTPQRVAGRVHAGPSFRCRPAEVLFMGFESGGVYTQTVEVTNVSLGFSTFRVLPLPEEVEGVLNVSFEAPGRMSAGRSTQLTVTFTPKKEEDLRSEVILLSPTGPQSLRVVCCCKRAVLSFYPPLQSPRDLLKWRKAGGTPLQSTQHTRSASSNNQRQLGARCAPKRDLRNKSVPDCDGQRDERLKGGVIYLPSGEVQLGEVTTLRLRLRNTGSLSVAYRLFPILPEEPSSSSHVPEPPEQQSRQPSDTTVPLQDTGDELTAEHREAQESNRSCSSERVPRLPMEEAESVGQKEEDISSHSAAAWLEALQGEAVVLAQRLRVSTKQNSLYWEKIASKGLAELLYKDIEGSGQKSRRSESTTTLSLNTTLVKNAAGELDAQQSQEISIVHAPTSTGRFVGFFVLQLSDPEVLLHH